MSTLAATNLKHASSASNNIVLDASGNTTVSGNAVVTGTLQANGVTGSVYPLVSGTAQASTSGTSIDFTGLPSWVKRVTVMFNGVSTNGTNLKLVQIGSGSPQTTGYLSSSTTTGTTSATSTTTTGFNFGTNIAADTINGIMTIATLGGNVWVSSHAAYANTTPQGVFGGGAVTLSGVLDRVRITTVGGTDTFDAGSINILYE